MHRIMVVVLGLATAGIHLAYFEANFDGVMMGLSGLGYLALLGLYLTGRGRRLLIAYTAVVFAGYLVYGVATGEWSVPLGPIAKVIELVLIGLLVREAFAVRSAVPSR